MIAIRITMRGVGGSSNGSGDFRIGNRGIVIFAFILGMRIIFVRIFVRALFKIFLEIFLIGNAIVFLMRIKEFLLIHVAFDRL
jgi:hypothetical protein